jgi:glycosyltransferase involved in cell wall biosynthesis
MSKARISGNMIVKNEDQWVWYAITSILPYVDELLVTDTGSTDATLQIIRSIKSPKLKLKSKHIDTAQGITDERNEQLQNSKYDWVWIIDGDEVYPHRTAEECVKAASAAQYEGVIVRRYDLLGDIYHRQREDVGSYHLFGQTGHLVTRLVNKGRIKGLHYEGIYPLEGWFDGEGHSTHTRNVRVWYVTSHYLYHAMYLKRSSLGGNLAMFNRSKYKIEKGLLIPDAYPEVFEINHPRVVPAQLQMRTLSYELMAALITPLKELKRRLV